MMANQGITMIGNQMAQLTCYEQPAWEADGAV